MSLLCVLMTFFAAIAVELLYRSKTALLQQRKAADGSRPAMPEKSQSRVNDGKRSVKWQEK